MPTFPATWTGRADLLLAHRRGLPLLFAAALAAGVFIPIRSRAPKAVAPVPTAARIALGARVYFLSDPSRPPQGVFVRPDVLYAAVQFPSPVFGNHVLQGRWIRPGGAVQETCRVRLACPPGGARCASLWIRFPDGGALSGEAPAAAAAFNGFWTLEVSLDEQWVRTARFELRGY